jgi:hypothetical protein
MVAPSCLAWLSEHTHPDAKAPDGNKASRNTLGASIFLAV